MLLGILLTVQIIICLAMGALILVQRSEGGALGMGGGPSGFMSARGAGNLLTKLTGILAVLFFVNCIGMTIVGNYATRPSSAVDRVDTSGLALPAAPTTSSAQTPAAAATSSSAAPSLNDLPLAGAPAAQPTSAQQSQAPSAAPVRLPSSSGLSSSSASRDVNAAKSNIWNNSSSSTAAASQP